MTIGQRIAQKRKELGLSQEGLGERLGVSRQSIHKWESDQVLPEVEKLVRLSRLFSVSVGWLLGVETDAADAPAGSRELTPQQIQMVEDIAGRYIAAIPQLETVQNPSPHEAPRRRRWAAALVCAALAVLTLALILTAIRLEALNTRYTELRHELDALSSQMNALSESNNMPSDTAPPQEKTPLLSADPGTDWGVTISEIDYLGETVSFDVWIRPSEEANGMNCQLVVTLDDADSHYPFEQLAGGLSVQVTVPIADRMDLAVLFYSEDRSELYPLTSYYGDDPKWAFPEASFAESNLLLRGMDGDTVCAAPLRVSTADVYRAAEITQLRVGLFRDQELVMWYEEIENAYDDSITSWNRPELTLEQGHIYCEAVVVTDEHGREQIFFDTPIEHTSQWQALAVENDTSYTGDPENWSY